MNMIAGIYYPDGGQIIVNGQPADIRSPRDAVSYTHLLTDPSYYGQIITQTYPLIGNYGMNSEDKESGKIWAKGCLLYTSRCV